MLAGKLDEFLRAKGRGEVMALGVVAAEAGQLGQLRLVLHAFGDDPHVQ